MDITPDKIKVFVSYARADLDFADQLVVALARLGHEPIIDRHGISGGEDWRERLHELILQADTVVFAVSPDSVTSDICSWEVNETIRLGKRLIPVICRDVAGLEVPETLQDLNYIFFYANPNFPGTGFGKGLVDLDTALQTDLDWFREQTRLAELAERWEQREREDDLLLRGTELKHYQEWLRAKPASAPDLTTLQKEFLAESDRLELVRNNAQLKQIESRRKAVRNLRNVTLGGLAAVLVLMVISLSIGYFAVQNTAQLDVRTSQFFTQNAKQARSQQDYKKSLFDLVHAIATTKRSMFSDYSNQEAEALLVDSFLNSPYRNGYAWEFSDTVLSVPLGDTGNLYVLFSPQEEPEVLIGKIIHVETGEVRKEVQRISIREILQEELEDIPIVALKEDLARLWRDAYGRRLFMNISQSGEEFIALSFDEETGMVSWQLIDSRSGEVRAILETKTRDIGRGYFPIYSANDAYVFVDADEGFNIFDIKTGNLVYEYAGEANPAINYIDYQRSEITFDGRFLPLELYDEEEETTKTILRDLETEEQVMLLSATSSSYSPVQGLPDRYTLDSDNLKWARCYSKQKRCEIGAIGAEAVVMLTGFSEDVYSVRFVAGGTKVLTIGRDADINLWDVTNGDKLLTYKPEKPERKFYSFYTELLLFERYEAAVLNINHSDGSRNNSFYEIDFKTNKMRLIYERVGYPDAKYDPYSDRFLVRGSTELAILDPRLNGGKTVLNDFIEGSLSSVEAMKDPEQLAILMAGKVHLLNVETGKIVHSIHQGEQQVLSIETLHGNALLTIAREDATENYSATYWRKPERNQYYVEGGTRFDARNVVDARKYKEIHLSPADDLYLGFAGTELNSSRPVVDALEIYDLATNDLLHRFRIEEFLGNDVKLRDVSTSIIFSPNGKSLLVRIFYDKSVEENEVLKKRSADGLLYLDLENYRAELLDLMPANPGAGEMSFRDSGYFSSAKKDIFYQTRTDRESKLLQVFKIDTSARTFEKLIEFPEMKRRDIELVTRDDRTLALIGKKDGAEILDIESGDVIKKLTDYLNEEQLADLDKYEYEIDEVKDMILFGFEGENETDITLYIWDYLGDRIFPLKDLVQNLVFNGPYKDIEGSLPGYRLLLEDSSGSKYAVYNYSTNELEGVLETQRVSRPRKLITRDGKLFIVVDNRFITYYDLQTLQQVYRTPHVIDNFSGSRLRVSEQSKYLVESRNFPHWFHRIEQFVYDDSETHFAEACEALPAQEMMHYMQENQISRNPCE